MRLSRVACDFPAIIPAAAMARVDHRVPGSPRSWLEADRIEGVTRRFHSHFGLHLGAGIVLEGQTIDERLGD